MERPCSLKEKNFHPKKKFYTFPKIFFIVTQKYPIFKTEKVSCIYLKKNRKFSKWKKIHVPVCWKTNFLYLRERVTFIHSFIYLFIFQRDPFQMSFVYGSENFYVSQTWQDF